MKKVVTILVALCMMVTLAFAETGDVIEINWSDFEASVADAGWGGGFVELSDIGLKIYIPDGLQQADLGEDYYAAFMTESMEQGVLVIVEQGNEDTTLDTIAQTFVDSGVTDLEYDIVNGLLGISFTLDEDLGYLVLVADNGMIISFVSSPMTDEGFQAVATVIMSSIQTID